MKRLHIILLSAALVAVAAVTAPRIEGKNKLDIKAAAMTSKTSPEPARALGIKAGPSAAVPLIVSVSGPDCAAALEAAGAKVTTICGTIATIEVPADAIESVAALDCVKALRGPRECSTSLYFAREITSTNPVQTGEGFEMPYTGEGVVTGLMDQGYDPNHINFMNSDLTASRVKAVHIFMNDDGTSDDYTTPEAIAAFTTDNKRWTHGTHTCGIMAGGYKGVGNYGLDGEVFEGGNVPYYGVATGADIVMTGGMLYDINIVNGVNKVVQYAADHKQPVVVNLSLGEVVGPHDGSFPVEQVLAQLGRHAIICMAAGNDGNSNVAVEKTLTDGDTSLTSGIIYSPGKQIDFQIWNSTSDAFAFEVLLFNKATREVVATYTLDTYDDIVTLDASTPDFGTVLTAAFGADAQVLMYGWVDPDNNRFNVECMPVLSLGSNAATPDVTFAFRATGAEGERLNGYIYGCTFSSFDMEGWTDGTPDGSISSIACGENVIVVGSMQSAQGWTSMDGVNRHYSVVEPIGSVNRFTSYGTTFDGRQLPDLCAPGDPITSSVSTYYIGQNPAKPEYVAFADANGRKNFWACECGTSMAAPFVSGTVALMLEADPTLNVVDVRNILKSTCTKPEGDITPKERLQWGAGRLNVEDAMVKTLEKVSGGGVLLPSEKPGIILKRNGDGVDVFAAGASNVEVEIRSLSGVKVASAAEASDRLTIDTSRLTKGVYIIMVKSSVSSYTTKYVIGR